MGQYLSGKIATKRRNNYIGFEGFQYFEYIILFMIIMKELPILFIEISLSLITPKGFKIGAEFLVNGIANKSTGS